MKRTLFLLLIFAGIIEFSNAQLKYSPGHIITTEGQSISGFLGEAPYTELRTSISFKKTRRKSEIIEYTSGQLQGFVYADGDTFESHEVPCAGKEFYADGDRAFFHVLAKGKIDLYELNGRKSKPFFLKKEGESLQLLCLSKNKDLDFRMILFRALEETITLEDLKNLTLKRKYIQCLVENFNNGTPLANIGDKEIVFPRWNFGGFIGHYASFTDGNFAGLTKGLSLEFGVLAQNRLSLSVHLQNHNKISEQLYRKKDINYGRERYLNAQVWTVRSNFYPIKRGVGSPYFFVGYQHTSSVYGQKVYSSIDKEEVLVSSKENELNTSAFLFGGGLRFFFKRHSIYMELVNPQEALSIQLGYRFALKN